VGSRKATARLVNGTWKATLRLSAAAHRVTVRAVYPGDATHLEGSVRRTVTRK
jgi:hypothetical protein